MDIKDFLPKYPNIEKSKYEVLNPYEDDFYKAIYHKKEFYENRLERSEIFPRERGMLTKHQKTIARYMSGNTPYNKLILVHSMGTGKCVAPNTNIYVNGRIERIEDLWDRYHSRLVFLDEVGEWSKPTEPLYVNSYVEKEGKIVSRPVQSLYRQKVSEKMRKITLQGGLTIHTTKSHKILTEKGWCNDFSNSKYIALPKNLICKERETDTDLLAILAWQIAKGHETNDMTIVQKDVVVLQKLVNHFLKLAERYQLNINPVIHFPKDRFPYLQVTSKDYRSFLEKRGYLWGNLSQERIIPEFIMNCPKEQLKLFLQNYFDANGCVSDKQGVELCSKSKKLIVQIYHLLKRFSIRSRIKERHQKGENIKRSYFYLYMTGLSARLFKDQISFGFSYKQEILNKLCHKKGNSNVEIYPVSEILRNIHDKFNIPKSKLGAGLYVDGKQQPGRQMLLKIINNLKTIGNNKLDEHIKLLEHSCDREIIFTKIISVEEYDYTGWVYDLEILEHHNYVANGIVTHNTCSAIGAIEQIKNEPGSTFTGAMIFAGGEGLLGNFTRELVEKCTPGQYRPEGWNKLTDLQKTRRISKLTKYYYLETFRKFSSNHIAVMSDEEIRNDYSNKVIVIDEVHNLHPQGEDDEVKTYWHFHRFLHLVQNCKIMLLSGTPMQDGPQEIASVANLLLPMDEQLPLGDKFLEEYMTKKGEAYVMRKKKSQNLKDKLKGYVSFLREAHSSVKTEYIGETKLGTLKHFVVAPGTMSKFQSKAYARAVEKDRSGKKSGVWNNAREASLFVYPDGSWGKDGFQKYIKKTNRKSFVGAGGKKKSASTYNLSTELLNALKGQNDEETMTNIRRYSVKYAQTIENILNTDGNCFIYSWFIKGSGAILFGLLLRLFDFSRANGKENSQGLRYAILTTKTSTPAEIRRIADRYNRPDNMNGKIIKVIIGSKTVSEGYSFRNVLFEAILTPWWNYSVIAQAIARGIRLGSHNDLIQAGQDPVVRVMQPVAIPKKYTDISVDLMMYEISEDKDIGIRSVLRLLMEVAFDCTLNYFRNHINGHDGSRECDYTTCDYKCEGNNMQAVHDGLDDADIDYSTYQLFYANPKIPLIRRKIEHLFRKSYRIDLESIINNLKNEFSEDEILNALHTIQEETESDEFDYIKFLEIYSRSPVKKIMNDVENLFREHFLLELDAIIEQFPAYTPFEVITALRTLINDSVIIINKYGIASYLREDNDVYFLVDSLTVNATFFSNYYTKYPHLSTDRGFENIMYKIYSMSFPKLVRRICQTETDKEFTKLMKSLPIQIQEIFIEASLVARDKKIKSSKIIRRRVLEYFKSYIKKFDNVWVSTLLKDGMEVLRCRDVNSEFDEWADCDKRYHDLLQEHQIAEHKKLREENPYGIIGTYNPATKDFCLVDLNREKAGQSKRKKSDKRLSHTGKVCSAGGWKLPELMEIAIKRLQIDPPTSFRKSDSRQTMITRIKKETRLMKIFTEEEIEDADNMTLRRALYWGTPPKEKGRRKIQFLCDDLRNWLEEKGLLQIDDQCGVQGKKKRSVTASGKSDPTKNYTLRSFVPSNDEEEFKTQFKNIAKLMGECFGIKKYRPDIDDSTWIMVFSRKKLVAFITVDKKNVLWNVCVAKNYRRQGIARAAMKMATGYVCDAKGKNPTLLVDNRDKDSNKLIRMYKSFGFEIKRADDRYTYMEHPCS